MKIGTKVILFSIVSAIILAFGYGTARATTFASQLILEDSQEVPKYRALGQTFTGISGDLKSFSLKMSAPAFDSTYCVSLYDETYPNPPASVAKYEWISSTVDNIQTFRRVVESCGNSNWAETGYTLNPALTYYLLPHNSPYWGFTFWGSNNDNAFTGGTIFDSTDPWHISSGTLNDLYFIFSNVVLGEAPETSIAIEYPVAGSTIGDFSYWTFLAQGLPEIFDEEQFYIYDIEYSGGFTMPIAEYHDTGRTAGGGEFFIDKENLLTDGLWGAKIKIYDFYFNLVLESPVISFTINTGIETPYPIGTCEGGSWVGDQFCKVLQFLFIPSTESLNRFKTLLDPIESKAPIGYFLLIKGAFSDMGEGSSPFNLPSDNAFDTNIFEPIKTGLTFIFWLILAFWIFKRISNLDI